MQETTGTCNIVGVFDDFAVAERAVRDLIDTGIPRDSIELKSNFMTGAAGHSPTGQERSGGGIAGFFNRVFGSDVPQDEQGHYAEAVRRGSTVVCVTAPQSQIARAAEIMNQHGAIDIDRRVAQYRQTGYERFDPNAAPYSADEVARERERSPKESAAIPVIEEELQVGKRVVRQGGVRVYSRVIEQPVEQNVTLREEHVHVERRPVDRPLTASDVDALRDQSIEMTESAEEPVISKRARVKEEVVVSKEATERTETVRDKVRRTEVRVDALRETAAAVPGPDFRSDYDAKYARSGVSYEAYEPAYNYGSLMANYPRYRDKSWSEVESQMRTDYLRQNPNSKWEDLKGAVQYGWDKVTRKR